MNSFKFFLFSILLLFSLDKINAGILAPTDTNARYKYEFGPIPRDFCSSHGKKELLLTSDYMKAAGKASITKNTDGSNTLKLTEAKTSQSGAVWYRTMLNLENGFVTQFNLEFKNHNCMRGDPGCKKEGFFGALKCFLRIFVCLFGDCDVELFCGADGIAFVLQRMGNDKVGDSGYGLGYKNLQNVFAIEFDVWGDQQADDFQDEFTVRHISMKMKPGVATASETDCYAYNKYPINFKNEIDEFDLVKKPYKRNSLIKIEYLNNQIRVFINNELQMAYYYPLYFHKEMDLPNNNFFFGFTGSTDANYYQEQIITNWRFWMVKPTPAYSYVYPMLNKNYKVNEPIEIGIILFDDCKNYFLLSPDSLSIEVVRNIKWDKTDDCDLEPNSAKIDNRKSAFYNLYPTQFIFTIKCSKPGMKYLRVIYDEIMIPSTKPITVEAGDFLHAKVKLLKEVDSVDSEEFKFIVTGFDDNENIVKIPSLSSLKEKLYINWPNPTDNDVTLYKIQDNLDSTYTYIFKPNRVGKYSITSDKLLSKYHGGSLSFSITAGKPYAKKSYIKVADENKKDFERLALRAGQPFSVIISLFDLYGNPALSTDITYLRGTLSVNYVAVDLPNDNLKNELVYKSVFTKKGYNSIEVLYRGEPLVCKDKCVLSIDSLGPDFDQCDLYKYDTKSTKFLPRGVDFFVARADVFQTLLVMNDKYGNKIDVITIANYEAIMSGNNMKPIKLCLDSSVPGGARITVCSKDIPAFNILVGKSDYSITVKEISSSKTKEFKFTLITDGNDKDAGNGDCDITKTSFTYLTELKNGDSIVAGITYSIRLQLNTNEGLRCNYWIEESKFETILFEKQTTDVTTLKKNTITGTYLVTLYVTKTIKSDGTKIESKKLNFKIDGTTIPKGLEFKLLPNDVTNALISSTDLVDKTALKSGVADQKITFSVNYFDKFDNPSAPVKSQLTIIITGLNDINYVNISPEPTITAQSDRYTYSFATKYCGNYTVRSSLFASQYSLTIDIGQPSAQFSEALLLITKVNIRAGDFLDIKITPRDSSGRVLTKKATLDVFKDFTVTVLEPESEQKINIPEDEANRIVKDDGTIIISYSVKKAGTNIWQAKFGNSVLRCEICSANINPSDVDFPKSDVFSISDGLFNKILPDNTITFENNKRNPVFELGFKDKFFNKLTQVPSSSIEISGYFTCLDQNKPNITHELTNSLTAGVLRFYIKNVEKYTNQLYNDNCSLIFDSKKIGSDKIDSSIIFPRILLNGDGKNDNMYGNDAIDLDNSNINPSILTFKAGSFVSFLLELKTPSNKYYKFLFGNEYIIHDDSGITGGIINVNKQRDAYYGQYKVTFTANTANEKEQILKIGYKTPTTDNKFITNPLKIIIQPNSLAFLTIDSTLVDKLESNSLEYQFKANCVSGNLQTVLIKAYDKYSNMISSLTESDSRTLNLGIMTSDSQTIKPNIIQNAETKGQLRTSFECTKVGKISISGLEFRDTNSAVINKYYVNVISGEINAENSIAWIENSNIIAGQSALIKVSLFDKHRNNFDMSQLTIDTLKKFVIIVRFIELDSPVSLSITPEFKKSSDGLTVQTSFILEKVGKYDVKIKYNGYPTQINNNILMVSPSLPSWLKISLALYNGDDGTYKNYDTEFNLQTNIQPLFLFRIFDNFNNIYPTFPNDWVVNLYMVNDEDKNEEGKLIFCSTDESKLYWNLCLNNVKRLEEYQNGNYSLKLFNSKISKDPTIYKVNLWGSKADSDTDPYGKLDLTKTVIIPNNDLVVIAGRTVTFTIELRTEKNKRVNVSYDDPKNKLGLKFSNEIIEKIVFSIEKGDRVGRYLVKLTPTKVNTNEITVVVEGTDFTGYKPRIIVKPAEISQLFIANNDDNSKTIEVKSNFLTSTVENPTSFLLLAKDMYQNFVPMDSQTSLTIQIKDPIETFINYDRSVTEKGLVSIKFQGKLMGKYTISIIKNDYYVTLSYGLVSIANSYGTIKSANNALKAGESISIQTSFFDKWLNPIKLDPKNFEKTSVYAQNPNDENWILLSSSDGGLNSENTLVVYNKILQSKGIYVFKCKYESNDLPMKISTVKVSSSDPFFTQTQISYFDKTSSKYVEMSTKTPLTEDNLKVIPKYFVLLRDQFQNIIDLKNENPYKLKLSLFNITEDTIKIEYESESLEQGLLFTLKDNATLTSYQNLLKIKNPFTLKLESSILKSSLNYAINIQGSGEDYDICNITDIDISKTVIGVKSLSYIAGTFSSFAIQIMCKSGFRRGNAISSDINGELDLKSGNDIVNATNGDIRGGFLISVSSSKASNYPINLTLNINDKKIVNAIQLFVKPNILKYIRILNDDFALGGFTDNDFIVEIQGYDVYDNLIVIDDTTVNLQFVFPENAPKEFNSLQDLENNKIIYTLKTRKAGTYSLVSSLLDSKKEYKFVIQPGLSSAIYSTVKLSSNSIKAGEKIIISFSISDKYANIIKPSYRPSILNEIIVTLKGESETIAVKLETDKENDLVMGSFVLKKIGSYFLESVIKGEKIKCIDCEITVINSEIEIKSTKFFKQQINALQSLPISLFELSQGSDQFIVLAQFYDIYTNVIKPENFLNPKLKLQANLSENNMIPLTLRTANQFDMVLIDVKDEDKEDFKNLVVANDYKLTLTLFDENNLSKGSSILPLNILGEANDAGNGPYDEDRTFYFLDGTDSLRLISGSPKILTLELRTKENKRYNGKEVDVIDVAELENKKNFKEITKQPSGVNGRYNFLILSELVTESSSPFILAVSVKKKVLNRNIKVLVEPDSPDFDKTNITKSLPSEIYAGQQDNITFTMRDRFGNNFKNTEEMNRILVRAVKGSANMSAVTFGGSDGFVVTITPQYPPRDLHIFLYYNLSNGNGLAQIIKEPIKTTVLTVLSLSLTQIQGPKFTSLTVDEDCSFYILLKDISNFCFETSMNVSVVFKGAYSGNDYTISEEASDKNEYLFKATEINSNENSGSGKIESQGYSCNKYYKVEIPNDKKVFKKVGFYQLDLFVEGQADGKSIMTLRKTRVLPGEMVPFNSVVRVIEYLGRGNGGVNVKTGGKISILVDLFDKYGNQIFTSTTDKLTDLEIPNLKVTLDYNQKIISFGNGTFLIELTLSRINLIDNFKFKLNDVEVQWKSLKKIDAPEFFNVIPSDCSAKYPLILYDNLKKNIIVGKLVNFTIQCQDKFENKVISNDNTKFEVFINGYDLKDVSSDIIVPTITSPKPGVFVSSFKIAWAGEYSITVMLNSEPYGESFKITGQSSVCSQEAIIKNTTLYQCMDDTCVPSYLDCNYEELSGKQSNPYKCFSQGSIQYVNNSHLCDCPDNYTKCEDEKKCVKDPRLCQTKLITICPKNYDKCPDNSCRKSISDCPAISVCPPIFKKCADNSCSKTLEECPEFQPCPSINYPNRIFKCSDQSCVENPKDCPSRISCPKDKPLLCPDKTCVALDFECRLPPTCESGTILCSDQSCRPTIQDCPKQITCPFGKALCQDGSCRDSCQNVVRQESKAISINSLKLNTGCDMNEYVCPGGECVSSYFLCSTMNSCPQGSVRCPDLSCATSLKECIQTKCKEGEVLCWDGMCVTNVTKCSTRTTCPESYPVKCHDGKCVKDVSDCSQVIPCPTYARYKCSNGDCKANKDDCPTSITCPQELPVQCSDGSCVKASYHCLTAVEKSNCNFGQIRCSDGSCANSKFLCPSSETCATDQIRCWDNSCVDDISECPKVKSEDKLCPAKLPLRCVDGSCRSQLQDCPTQIVCPTSRSIKCDDGTCKESKSQCARNSKCGFGLRKCPDGSCSAGKCGTPITCSTDAPFKCYDNTCRKDPRDCIPPPTCTKDAPILCGDGVCVGQRYECKSLTSCPQDTPVKCPDNNCYASINSCVAIEGCPNDFVQCEDGSCATSAENCPSSQCPAQLRYKCLDGFCVSDLKYCDLTTNGCPFNRPFKCNNGLCTYNETSCPKNNTYNCSQGKILCPDGSCVMQGVKCGNIMGCPAETPFRCSSGICIDLKKKECPMNLCPSSTPIKCLNGLCVKTISNCPSMLNSLDYEQCLNELEETRVPCADSRCVVSSDLCRPVFSCPEGTTRCNDGSCRLYDDLCPITESTCLPPKLFRCSTGACAISSDECLNDNGCPKNYPIKCEKNGACVKLENDCQGLYDTDNLANKCFLSTPFRCPNATCVAKSSDCISLSRKCPFFSAPYECLDGSCVTNIIECLTKEVGCDKITCPDGTCKASYSECKAANDCPLDTPYRCLDGSCKALPLNFQNLNDPNSCSPGLLCPEFKPYKCADGECQGDSKMCRPYLPCPSTLPLRCQDGSCAATIEACSNMVHCPISTPILCASGMCVEDPLECSNSLNCPDEKPIYCSSGVCVTYYWQCLMGDIASGKSRRVLQSENEIVNVNIDTGCNKEKPYRCLDGHCESNLGNCPVITSCHDQNLPIRCKSGICVSSQDKCKESEDALLETIICAPDTIRCLDGTCRKICLPFNGCEGYHCGNGYCASSLGECAGDSTCPLHKPFRCLNNTCVATLNECSRRKRDTVQDPMILTLSSFNSDTKEFLLDKSTNLKYGKLKIPAGALTSNKSDYALLMVRSVGQSEAINLTTVYEESLYDYVGKTFPLNDGYLSFHQSVRSPIVELSSLSNNNATETKYKFPIVLELDSDLIVNSNKSRDYCLAKMEKTKNQWKCISRDYLQTNSFSNETFAFPIHQDGSYAIIYNPDILPVEKKDECDFLCKNKNTIIIVSISVFVAIIIFSFIVWRVSRYMTKYRTAKKQIENYKEQISELQNNQTDIVGQTVRDKIEGISFTQNPLFTQTSSGTDPEKIKGLENNVDRLMKREKVLQKAAEELTERNMLLQEDNENLKKELRKLKEARNEDQKSIDIISKERKEFD